jgi:uncharacterized Zn-finger protein
MYCGKSFSRQFRLQRHVKGVHLGVKFRCDICQRTYTQMENLNAHKKMVHAIRDLKWSNPFK